MNYFKKLDLLYNQLYNAEDEVELLKSRIKQEKNRLNDKAWGYCSPYKTSRQVIDIDGNIICFEKIA
jgi:hypothetical protein